MVLANPKEETSPGDELDVAGFITGLHYEDLPPDVRLRARRSLLDLIGVAAGGSSLAASEIARDHTAEHLLGARKGARMLFDGRRVSVPGSAFAGAATIEALSAHDGHRKAKGHPGVAILPALAAVTDEIGPCQGDEFLTRLVVGYEIGLRAAIGLHSGSRDFHASGSWNAVGAAAAASRALGLREEALRHALGTAEFFAPRSPMLRAVDYPTMVREGAAAGAYAGVSAALLARSGFTGAPAEIVDHEPDGRWETLGSVWMMRDLYLKPWPVSRWAHPAIEAALDIRSEVIGRKIARLVVETFEEATRLSVAEPQNTEAAQCSVSFAVAAAIVKGSVDISTVTTDLGNPEILALAGKVELAASATLSSVFPEKRQARLILIFENGDVLRTQVREARGEPETPLSDTDLIEKFLANSEEVIGRRRAFQIAEAVAGLERADDTGPLLDLITARAQA